jgi:anti-sigma factor RsiW
MKDSEFIELLNLYLDHEISPAESARLEAEVTRSPERLRLYRQYCRMQKACVELAERSHEEAPAQDALAAAFAPRSARSGLAGLWTTGLMAAAAGIAIITISHRSAVAPSGSSVTPSGPSVAQSAPAVPAPAGAPAQMVAPASDDFHPVFFAPSMALNGASAKPGSMFNAADQNVQFAWMNRVQIAPIQLAPNGSVFVDPKPSLKLDSSAAGDRTQGQDAVEETAFQFAK